MSARADRSLPSSTEVLVLGGGLAGLSCAVGLAESGLAPLVLEKENRLGGRASSWTDRKTGDTVHIGPHVLLNYYPNMFALMDRCGTREKVIWQEDPFITVVDGRQKIPWRMASLPPPMTFLPSLLAEPGLGWLDKLSGTRITLYAMGLDEEDILELDGINCYALLRSLGVTERSIRRIWSFMSMAIMNVPIELVSAGAMMRFFRRFTGTRGFRFGFPTVGLSDLYVPGSRRIIERAGGRVVSGVAVKQLLGEGGRCTGVTLADGRTIRARQVISTLPPSALLAILPRGWAERHPALAELDYFQPCPYVSPYLWFDRKLTGMRFWARAFAPSDLNCDFYDLSNINEGRKAKGSLICSNIIFSHRATALSDEEVVEATRAEIAELLPAARKARVTRWLVNRIPMAIHCPFPGTEKRRPAQETSVKGLTLAGDWTRTGLPSSMEGATFSGWRAAEITLAALGRKAPALSTVHKDVEGISWIARQVVKRVPRRSLKALMRPLRMAPFPVSPL